MRRLSRGLVAAVAAVSALACLTVHGANLQFALRSSWAPTPLAIEASEFFTDASQYFTFITKYNQQLSSSPSPPSDRLQYQTALSIASELLGPSSLSVLSSTLSLRALSPAAETLRSMRANRVAKAVQSIPFDRPEAQEIKDASEAQWNACRALLAFEGRLHCGTEGIDWNAAGAAVATEDDAESDNESESVQSFDHVHPSSDVHGTPVILYADPASPEFAVAHAAIVAQLAKQPLRYVLRPCVASPATVSSSSSSPSASSMSLQGFGVELAIKNMEYKVLDDSKIAMGADDADAAHHADLPDDDAATAQAQAGQEIAGFNFEVLKRRRPELGSGLDALRDLLTKEASAAESESGGAAEKKVAVWELKDLGFQASQRVLLSSSDPLAMLRDLSQNFPMYAQALTRTRINATLKAAVEAHSLGSAASMHAQAGFAALPAPGTNALEINGVVLELGANAEELDYFAVLDTMKAEARCIDDLAGLSLAPQSVARLLQEVKLHSRAESESAAAASQSSHAAQAHTSPFLLHMATSSPATKRILVFLNDIERDARYKPWPVSLQEYLAPSWPNQLKYVRKNAYTAVILADPAHAKGLEFVHQARFFVQNNAPMRMGVVFWIPSIKPAAAASAKAKAAATAAAAVRPAWNVDVLSKLEGVWADFVGDSDDDEGSAALAVSGPVADLASPQAKVAKLFYWLLSQGGLEGAAGGKRTLTSRDHAFEFVAALHESNPRRTGAVTDGEMESVFAAVCKRHGYTGAKARSAAQVWAMPEFDELVQSAHDYALDRGFADDDTLPGGADSTPGQLPLMVVNGVVHRSAATKSFRDVMMGAIMEQQHKIMMAVYTGALNDRMDIHETLQSRPNVLRRINPAITSLVAQMHFVTAFPRLDSPALLPLKYLRAPDADTEGTAAVATQSYFLIADWSAPRGLAFVADLLEFVAKAAGNGVSLRAALFFNNAHSDAAGGAAGAVARVASTIMHASPALSESQRFELLQQLVMLARYFSVDSAERQSQALELFLTTNAPKLDHARAALASTDAAMHGGRGLNPSLESGYIAAATGLLPGESALVLNGRLISLSQPVFQEAASIVPDLRLLSEFTAANFDLGMLADLLGQPAGRASPIQFTGAAASRAADPEWLSEVLMRSSFVLLRRSIAASASAAGGPTGSRSAAPSGEKLYASLDPNSPAVIRVSNPASLLSIRAVIDPLSKAAQKLAPVLIALRDQFAPNMLVWLSPKSGLTEFPLKRFYRYALAPGAGLSFDDESGAVRPFSGALFRGLRTKHILSTVMFTPESWSIRLRAAKQDLDNLNVAELNAPGAAQHDAVQHVSYELEHLLLFGQCLDPVRMEPPAGLQLMLGSSAVPFMGDTVVMQNLGYFQLKAGPGEWTVSIADQRHAEIYEIQPEEQSKEAEAGSSSARGVRKGTRQLFIRSFNEGFVRLDVLRKPHQENAQLLDPSVLRKRGGSGKKAYKAAADAVGNMWNSVFGGEAGPDASAATNADGSLAVVDPVMLPRSGETIHVFSLASGHLYERFLKIMMLSVLGSTRAPVKFWFLANFASPQFRDFVPLMARQLGFEAEFVTYKWPVWLRRQEEKQRIIWGYKILFLDVLFPLAVQRVIYIDADQVVRGDIAELWSMDLQGAPYAYTPFCDSNTATEGFRFWKSGYWKDHLKGRPYHISALYVVDLQVFRSMRAGDSLRGIYDNLSADPNSLANLDQDLPAFASTTIPIHSLPIEWLWCETWCALSTLPQAKSIDLCNNPLTKTPKLEVAKQLIPEWAGLDNRARALGELFAERAAAAAAAAAQTQVTGHAHHSHRHTAAASEETVSVPANAEAIRQAQQTVLH